MIEISEKDFPELKNLVSFEFGGCWVGGGYIRDMILGAKPSDIDVFGPDQSARDSFIKNNGVRVKKSAKFMRTGCWHGTETPVQVIDRDFKDIADMISRFDFTVCQFAWDGKNVFATERALVDVARRRIQVANIQEGFELDSMRRLYKYMGKGFSVCANTLKEVAEALRRDSVKLDEQIKFYPDGSPVLNVFD